MTAGYVSAPQRDAKLTAAPGALTSRRINRRARTTKASINLFMKNSLTIRHMRLLIAIDDHHSVIRAATYLNLTQPAVSKALSGLEAGLGAQLFRRSKSGLVATQVGACLIRHARRVVLRIELAERELNEIIGVGFRHVSIGTLPAAAVFLVPRFIARLERETQNTTISLREGTMDNLLPALRTGQIDLAVGLMSSPQLGSDISTEVLLADPVVAAVRRGHLLLGQGPIAWSQLEGFPLLLPPPNTLARGAIESLFHSHMIDVASHRIDSVSTMANVGTLQLTDSVGFLSRSLVEHFRRLGVLDALPLDIPAEVTLEMGLVWVTERERTDAHLLTHRLLRETALTLKDQHEDDLE